MPGNSSERRVLTVTQSPTLSTNPLRRLWHWLPETVTRPVRVLAWLSLILQIGLIGTGGAVRLTASGLGCPTWPNCTASSFVPTPELGIHGIIEFTNRMLTIVLSIVVILVFLVILRMRKQRRDLFVLTLLQGLSIPFQAVLGGISVLTGLNPYVVGSHFLVSIVLVVLTTNLVYRAYHGRRAADRLTPRWFVGGTIITCVFVGITVIFGVLTTGAGPHAGDNSNAKALAPRNGLNPVALQDIHSIPAYITFGLTLALVLAIYILASATHRRDLLRRVRFFSAALLAVELVQILVGITQAKEGLPIALVNIHLVLAAILVAAITALLLSQRGINLAGGDEFEASTGEHDRRIASGSSGAGA
jgi:cytochrome c oxidase assembly protein subunit 15